MGDYFFMSKRFNKRYASDFGLLQKDINTAVNPIDNSLWMKSFLYDFGWGKENGFYKEPLPNFSILLNLALYSEKEDDKYGAVAIILEKFADDLLYHCEMIMGEPANEKEFKKMVDVFNLKRPINRSPTSQKTYEQIQSDYKRWKRISDIAAREQRHRPRGCKRRHELK